MDSLQTFYDHHSLALWALSIVLIGLLSGGWLVLARRARRLEARLEDLFGDASSDRLAPMLADYLGTVRSTALAVQRMRADHDEIASMMPTAIRHVGLVRFSPFHDTGGDQSFALALLDGRGDGVIMTALHSRTESRLYAKPIERGMSSYTLIPEERAAMDRAFQRETAAVSR